MLSYQHAYHAGGYADVVKHLILSRIIHYMQQKDKPFLYLDTHSGRGLYDIKDHFSQKTQEAKEGIIKLWAHRFTLPDEFSHYFNIIASMNLPNELRYYPGSPKIAIELLRPLDRIYLCERHPQEIHHLQKLKIKEKQIYIEETDGIKKINGLIPPKEKRALIFIDPSYELKEEYKEIPKTIAADFKKFPNGVYCLWYPILHSQLHLLLIKKLSKISPEKTLKIEFFMENTSAKGLLGTGLFILNPPYTLEYEARNIMKNLQKIYSDKKTLFKVNE